MRYFKIYDVQISRRNPDGHDKHGPQKMDFGNILFLRIPWNYPSKQTLTEGEFGIQSGKSM